MVLLMPMRARAHPDGSSTPSMILKTIPNLMSLATKMSISVSTRLGASSALKPVRTACDSSHAVVMKAQCAAVWSCDTHRSPGQARSSLFGSPALCVSIIYSAITINAPGVSFAWVASPSNGHLFHPCAHVRKNNPRRPQRCHRKRSSSKRSSCCRLTCRACSFSQPDPPTG